MKKNENYPKYVQAMHLMDEGKSINYVCQLLKMGRVTVKLIRQRYLRGGELALLHPQYQPLRDTETKIKILRDITDNHLSLLNASLKYDIQVYTIRRWIHAYQTNGIAGLTRKRKQTSMKKKRQRTEAELDELEKLRKRNEYLEAENALLKKVKALVEERENRLRAIGRGPSKN